MEENKREEKECLIFICHSGFEKADYALKLQQLFQNTHLTSRLDQRQVFVDRNSVHFSADGYEAQLQSAIKQCQLFVVIFSPTFFNRPHAVSELELALQLNEQSNHKNPVIAWIKVHPEVDKILEQDGKTKAKALLDRVCKYFQGSIRKDDEDRDAFLKKFAHDADKQLGTPTNWADKALSGSISSSKWSGGSLETLARATIPAFRQSGISAKSQGFPSSTTAAVPNASSHLQQQTESSSSGSTNESANGTSESRQLPPSISHSNEVSTTAQVSTLTTLAQSSNGSETKSVFDNAIVKLVVRTVMEGALDFFLANKTMLCFSRSSFWWPQRINNLKVRKIQSDTSLSAETKYSDDSFRYMVVGDATPLLHSSVNEVPLFSVSMAHDSGFSSLSVTALHGLLFLVHGRRLIPLQFLLPTSFQINLDDVVDAVCKTVDAKMKTLSEDFSSATASPLPQVSSRVNIADPTSSNAGCWSGRKVSFFVAVVTLLSWWLFRALPIKGT